MDAVRGAAVETVADPGQTKCGCDGDDDEEEDS